MVDTKVDTRLTRIFTLLEDKHTKADVARDLKISRQAASKLINRLEAQGRIAKTSESTCNLNFYHVNQNLVQHDKLDNFDLHNIEVVIPIERLGKLPQGKVSMKNWKYAHLDFGFFNVMVNYGKEPTLKILPPKEYGESISDVLVKAGSKIERLVMMLRQYYHCKVDMSRMRITRRPHLHPLNDPVLREAEKLGIQYTGKNIELNRSGDAHGDVLGFDGIRKYDEMLDVVPKAIEEIRQLISGSVATQNAIANTQMMMAATLKLMAQKRRREAAKGHVSPEQLKERNEWLSAVIEGKACEAA